MKNRFPKENRPIYLENVAKLTNPKIQNNENEENPYSDPLNADEAAQEAEIDPQGQNMLLQDAVDIDEQLENVESQAETRLTGKSVIDQLQRELEKWFRSMEIN